MIKKGAIVELENKYYEIIRVGSTPYMGEQRNELITLEIKPIEKDLAEKLSDLIDLKG